MLNKKNIFTWGETVQISEQSPVQYHPGEYGFVCGMLEMDSNEVAEAYDCVGSNWLYTIEFIDGSTHQIPEYYLEKYQDEQLHK